MDIQQINKEIQGLMSNIHSLEEKKQHLKQGFVSSLCEEDSELFESAKSRLVLRIFTKIHRWGEDMEYSMGFIKLLKQAQVVKSMDIEQKVSEAKQLRNEFENFLLVDSVKPIKINHKTQPFMVRVGNIYISCDVGDKRELGCVAVNMKDSDGKITIVETVLSRDLNELQSVIDKYTK